MFLTSNMRNELSRRRLAIFAVGDNISTQLGTTGLYLLVAGEHQTASDEGQQYRGDSGDNPIVTFSESSGAPKVCRNDNDGVIFTHGFLGSIVAGFLTYAGLKRR